MDITRVDRRFPGPPTSGNGGYVAGLLAETVGGSDWEITLRKPPPLDRDLELRSDGMRRSLWDGDELVASAQPAIVGVDAPPPPDLRCAEAASAHFTGFSHHIFPGCFVCGPERKAGDGLRIFAGPLNSTMVAAPWVPEPDLCDEQGLLRPRFIWAALDCPGYFAVQEHAGAAVLGRFAVHVERRPSCGTQLAVVGWHLGSDGRKHRAGTGLYEGEQLVACGEATWISLQERPA